MICDQVDAVDEPTHLQNESEPQPSLHDVLGDYDFGFVDFRLVVKERDKGQSSLDLALLPDFDVLALLSLDFA